MKRTFFDLFGVLIMVRTTGDESSETLFPVLTGFPGTSNRTPGWQLHAGYGPVPGLEERASPAQVLRVFPDVQVAYRVGADGSIEALAHGALASIHRDLRTARLTFRPRAVHAARKVGSFLIVEVLRCEGIYPVHAAAVDFDGGVVLICGRSGAGKSTFACAWASLGRARFMGDDQSVIFRRSGRVWACGVPTPVALLPDGERLLVERGVRFPPAIAEAEGKRSFACDTLGHPCREARPVRAILHLDSSSGTAITACPADLAGPLLLQSSLYPGEPSLARAHFDALGDLAAQAPAFLVGRAAGPEHVISEVERVLDRLPFHAAPPFASGRRSAPAIGAKRASGIMRLLCRIASMVLSAAELEAIGEADWSAIVLLADRYRLLPLLAIQLDAGGRLDVLPPTASRALRSAAAHARSARQAESGSIDRIRGELDAAGIPWCLVDAVAIAETFYPNSSARPSCGLDLVVAPETAAAVRQRLSHVGFVTGPTVASGGAGDAAEESLLAPPPLFCAVNLHASRLRFLPQAHPVLAPRELLKRAVGRGRVPSTPVVALVDQVAISALRFIHGDPWDEFLHLFDLRFMVGGVDEERWRTIVDHAAEVGARTALRLALRTASRFLPLPATVRRSAAHRGRLAERLLGTLADPVLGAVAPWRSSTVARRKILSAIVRGSA